MLINFRRKRMLGLARGPFTLFCVLIIFIFINCHCYIGISDCICPQKIYEITTRRNILAPAFAQLAPAGSELSPYTQANSLGENETAYFCIMFNKILAQVSNTLSSRETDQSDNHSEPFLNNSETPRSNKRNRETKSNDSTPEQDLKRIREKSSENLNTSSDFSEKSYSDLLEMDEDTLKLIIGTLIKESEERTKTHITDSLQPVQDILEKVKLVEQTVLTLRNDVERIHDEQRKNNVIVYGLAETNSETRDDIAKVVEGLSNSLKIGTIDYDDAFRLGQRKNGLTRPLIIKLIRYRDKQAIFAGAKNLQGTKISITNDKSKETRIAELSLKKKKADILKHNPKVKCTLRSLKLKVSDGNYTATFAYDPNINDIVELPGDGISMQS
jgi:hypothetical protein